MKLIIKFILLAAIVMMQIAFLEAAGSPTYLTKWQDNKVYFRFAQQYDEDKMKTIRAALKSLENIVCVKIEEITDSTWRTPAGRKPITIINSNSCWSYIGDVTKQKDVQEVSLNSEGCILDSTVKHEFMHLLGLEHEQSRSDRDDYIKLDESKILGGKNHNLDVEKTNNYGKFDFQSNMLYWPWGMAKTPWKAIWTVKQGKGKYDDVVENGAISWQDAKALNTMYECDKKCRNKCVGDAYLNKECKCITPDEFAEEQCYDLLDDCKDSVFDCANNQMFAQKCRKTCGRCYKSPNGIGVRGHYENCEDNKKLCAKLAALDDRNKKLNCDNNNFFKFYCRKTCQSGCFDMKPIEIGNGEVCQDFYTQCEHQPQWCNSESGKNKCAKTCKLCT